MSSTKAASRKPTSRGRDYGYSNARVRGMRSRLLTKAYFDQLIDTWEWRRLLQTLSETEYGPDLETTLLHGRTFAAVDEALKNNMVRTFQKILSIVNGEAHFLVTTMLARWDLFNIKTIVRGKHMRLSAQEIEDSLIPAGELTHVELTALSNLEDVRAVVDTLSTWGMPYAPVLREAMGDYVHTNELSKLELAIDKYYTQWADKRLKKRRHNYVLARDVLAVQTDATNLLTVLRLLKADVEGMDAGDFFLPGGQAVSEKLFRELAALSDIDEVLDRLKGTPFGKALSNAVMLYLETNSIAVLERSLEDFVMRRAISSNRGDPLGAGVIISYLWAKQNEVTNLRIIVKGNAVGMPPERVRRELIFV